MNDTATQESLFDFEIAPASHGKHRLALIQAIQDEADWSIGERGGKNYLNRKGVGDRLSFRRETNPSSSRLNVLSRCWVIRDAAEATGAVVANFEWKPWKGGSIVCRSGNETSISPKRTKMGLVSSPWFSLSRKTIKAPVIDVPPKYSRLSIPAEYSEKTEVILIAAYLIIRSWGE
ncbi:MAG: hypothetical protein KDN19_17145 [Verrucomicrobiae bacterium]|nr:hypothetical protein [Verrucomicrobiae bacterium]